MEQATYSNSSCWNLSNAVLTASLKEIRLHPSIHTALTRACDSVRCADRLLVGLDNADPDLLDQARHEYISSLVAVYRIFLKGFPAGGEPPPSPPQQGGLVLGTWKGNRSIEDIILVRRPFQLPDSQTASAHTIVIVPGDGAPIFPGSTWTSASIKFTVLSYPSPSPCTSDWSPGSLYATFSAECTSFGGVTVQGEAFSTGVGPYHSCGCVSQQPDELTAIDVSTFESALGISASQHRATISMHSFSVDYESSRSVEFVTMCEPKSPPFPI